MPMPVIPGVPPEVWEEFLQLLAGSETALQNIESQGITLYEAFKQWLIANDWIEIPIFEQVQTGTTWAHVSAVDPANTNAVSTQVVTDVATVGGTGTAVSTVTSGGNRTLGLVTKAVVVGACLSLLVSTIGAGLVSDDVQEDLITSADPYTIDGENVVVLIDGDGKTHFPSDFVEAIRQKCVELGIFDTGDIIIPGTISANQTFYSRNTRGVISSFTASKNTYDSSAQYIFQSNKYYTQNGVRVYPRGYQTQTIYNFKTYGIFIRDNDLNLTRLYIVIDVYDVSNTDTDIQLVNENGVSQLSYTKSIYGLDRTTFTHTMHTSTITSGLDNLFLLYGSPYTSLTGDINTITYGVLIGEAGGGGIEGITPAQDLITAGITDVTKKITEVIPALDTGKLQTANPTETDLENKYDWYPVSVNSADVFTTGATEDETSTATDGNVAQGLEPSVIQGLQELIEQLLRDPDNPDQVNYPEIPVGDNGDTPPENPPVIPPSDATGSNGLWSIYNPTLTQVNNFGAWLWSDTLADQFKRIFNSPIDGIIGFHMIYCSPTKGTAKNIKCGFLDSGVLSDTVASPYVDIDCGTVTIPEYYRNALDYDNTRISVYLPFVGIIPLDTNVVMSSDLNVTYRVDVLTGTCLAQIKVIKENSAAVMYAYEGNCAVQIPLTATTYTGMVGALISGVSAGLSLMAGNIAQTVTSGVNAIASAYSGQAGVKQSGTLGANAGALGIRIPYVIITHPVSAMPYMFNSLDGLPSNEYVLLSSLSGFTRVKSVHLENIGNATDDEMNMIYERLQEGVII